MQATFHRLDVRVFCYATENKDLLRETFEKLCIAGEFSEETVESEHGNRMTILQTEFRKEKECAALFAGLGTDVLRKILDRLDDCVDEDCVIYIRLDKQAAVQGRYEIAHHGDVFSITGKIVSHPARKEIAIRNLSAFINKLIGE